MEIQQYLEEQIKNCGQYELTDLDKKLLDSKGIEEYIFAKLTSKKFRKWKADDLTKKQYTKAVARAVSQNRPLQIVFPFGGYKLWRIPTTPEVDWAEFFMIAYYSTYVAPILAAYEPGVRIIFSSDEVVVERMNNIAQEFTELYFKSFESLTANFKKYSSKNLDIVIKRVRDLYDSDEELEIELQKNLARGKEKYEALSDEGRARELTTSELNIKWDGVRDWTILSDEEKKEKIKQGVIIHETYRELSKRKALVRGEDSILIFTTPIPNALALGTTKTSIAKFWVGTGVMTHDGESFAEYIVSPKQWETIKDQPHEIIKINLLPFKNFQEVLVYPQKFNFMVSSK